MLLPHEIRPVTINVDGAKGVVRFEVQGWRNHEPFSLSGQFPLDEHARQDGPTFSEATVLKMLLRDIANTL